jgi:hypothetical protein
MSDEVRRRKMSKDKDEREEEEVEERDKRLRKRATELQVKQLKQLRDVLNQYETVEDMPPDIREEFEQIYYTLMTNDKIRKEVIAKEEREKRKEGEDDKEK